LKIRQTATKPQILAQVPASKQPEQPHQAVAHMKNIPMIAQPAQAKNTKINNSPPKSTIEPPQSSLSHWAISVGGHSLLTQNSIAIAIQPAG